MADLSTVNGSGSNESVEERQLQIRTEISRTDSTWDIERLEGYLAKLSGRVAALRVKGTRG